MRAHRRRTRIVVLGLATAAVLLPGCQREQTMWASCDGTGDVTGTDGAYVLVCEDGTWHPVMRVDELVARAQGETTPLAPLPTRPPTTTTTTTTPTTTTTSTTTTTADPCGMSAEGDSSGPGPLGC